MTARSSPVRMVALLLLAVAVPSCGLLDNAVYPPDSSDQGGIAILASNPLTGTLSFMGAALENSMELAVGEINTAGGIGGRRLRLVKTDSHSDGPAGLAEARFFYERNPQVVAIAGSSPDAVSKRLLSDIARNDIEYGYRIPIVSPTSTSPEFVGIIDSQYNLFLRTVCSSRLEMSILAAKAGQMGFRVGAVIGPRSGNNDEMFRSFRERFETLGADRVAVAEYYDDDTAPGVASAFDRAYAAALTHYGGPPDFLLLLGIGQDAKTALNEWARRRSATPLLLTSSLMSDYFLSSLNPKTIAELDAGQVNGVFPDGLTPGRGSVLFRGGFCTAYPWHCRCDASPQVDCGDTEALRPASYAAQAYDAVAIVALALASLAHDDPSLVEKGPRWDVDRFVGRILRVTNQDGPDDVVVHPGEWARAFETIRSGKEINYAGASSSELALDINGDPTNCTYSFWSIVGGRVVLKNSNGNKESLTINL